MKKKKNIFARLAQPVSRDEDSARREFILNILLVASIGLFFVAFCINLAKELLGNSVSISAEIIFSMPLSFFIFLFFISKKGWAKFSAFLFLVPFFVMASYMAFKWGADLPSVLMLYVLIIVMAGVLISTRIAFIVTALIVFVIFAITYMQSVGIMPVDLYWTQESAPSVSDAFVMGVIFSIIATVSWISNREIEKSLKRARISEAALKKERDSLEITVDKRTRELKESQLAEMAQLYRFAEFGRLSSGLFHDLINPLNAVSLNIEKIKEQDQKNDSVSEAKIYLEKSIMAVRKMQGFISAVKKQIAQQEEKINFFADEEVRQVIDILAHKALKKNVVLEFFSKEQVRMFGNAMKFNQVVLNLISNSIDAYENSPHALSTKKERKVRVSLNEVDSQITLIVEDWGSGINKKDQERIFEPFFTTKSSEKGMGIGLSLVKRIVERDFNGSLKLESEPNRGTCFKIIF